MWERYLDSLGEIPEDSWKLQELQAAMKNNKESLRIVTSYDVTNRYYAIVLSELDPLNDQGGLEKLSFPDLHSVLKRIESILNSLPLEGTRGDRDEGSHILTPLSKR
jgi:uncharacterized protein HemY